MSVRFAWHETYRRSTVLQAKVDLAFHDVDGFKKSSAVPHKEHPCMRLKIERCFSFRHRNKAIYRTRLCLCHIYLLASNPSISPPPQKNIAETVFELIIEFAKFFTYHIIKEYNCNYRNSRVLSFADFKLVHESILIMQRNNFSDVDSVSKLASNL
jgi:hypothetical protein